MQSKCSSSFKFNGTQAVSAEDTPTELGRRRGSTMRIASGIRGVADLAEEEATENLNPLKVNIRFAGKS